jgi:hypothetical protein
MFEMLANFKNKKCFYYFATVITKINDLMQPTPEQQKILNEMNSYVQTVYTGLGVNPATVGTTVDYQQRTGLIHDQYVYGPVYPESDRRRRSPTRRTSPRWDRRHRHRRSPIKYESAYTPYSVDLQIAAQNYVPQPYREWPYTRPRVPFRYWTNRWDPMYGLKQQGVLMEDSSVGLGIYPGYSPMSSCVMKVYLEEAFYGDMLQASEQQWRDWAINQGFVAIAFPKDRNVTDHVFVIFDGVCPINMNLEYLPHKLYQIQWLRY